MRLPEIVYLQTVTKCDGHCRYCPFDDVYGVDLDGDGVRTGGALPRARMSCEDYMSVICWLAAHGYKGRLGFLLQYEPTLDERLPKWIWITRSLLPSAVIELATNGLHPGAVGSAMADEVCRVPAGSRTLATSRAGNARACPEIASDAGPKLGFPQPCDLPANTMSVAATGEVLLCCQDWRHEAVVGTTRNLTAARRRQLELAPKVRRLEPEICRDCAAGKTAEEVGERLGRRRLP